MENFVLLLILAGLFGLFMLGFTQNSIWLAAYGKDKAPATIYWNILLSAAVCLILVRLLWLIPPFN